MKISVIMPCYNAESFIADALQSISEQEIKPHEILIIDDGSTDSSIEVVKAQDIPIPIRIFETDRKGAAAARNIGIRAAEGEWLAFLDADDLWLPEHLRRAIHVIKKYDIAGYINHYHHIRHGKLQKRSSKVPHEILGYDIDDYIEFFLQYKHFVGMSACMVIRDKALKIGGLLEKQTWRHDIEFWLRVIENARWYFDPTATSIYRKLNPGGLSTNHAEAAYYGLIAFKRHRHRAKNLHNYNKVLEERARSAITRSFESQNQIKIERAYKLAFKHLNIRHKIFFTIIRQQPKLFPFFRRLKLV